jgi:predicted ArsR family transcriptional regulator
MSPSLQEQARALGDPTRHDIFRYVVDAGAGVDVAELTAHFGLNHNAIRQHLAKLVQAELVIEATAPSRGRGRPRLVYHVHPAAGSRWGATGPYERLSVLLAEIIRTGDSPIEVGRRAGRQLVAENTVSESGPERAVAAVVDAMAREGFEPAVRSRGRRREIMLRACPFVTTVLADADTVCALHLGIAEGVAERTGGRVVVDSLVPQDPRRANCRLHVHVEDEHGGR